MTVQKWFIADPLDTGHQVLRTAEGSVFAVHPDHMLNSLATILNTSEILADQLRRAKAEIAMINRESMVSEHAKLCQLLTARISAAMEYRRDANPESGVAKAQG